MKITAKDGTCLDIDEASVSSDDWGVLSFKGVLSGLKRFQRDPYNDGTDIEWETEEPVRLYVRIAGFPLMQQAAAATHNRSHKSKDGPLVVGLLDAPKWRRVKP